MKIIKFEKEDCMPCKQVSLFLDSKAVQYETVNPFNEPELAAKYNVRSVPTTILLKDDEVSARVVGFKPDELAQMLN